VSTDAEIAQEIYSRLVPLFRAINEGKPPPECLCPECGRDWVTLLVRVVTADVQRESADLQRKLEFLGKLMVEEPQT